MGERGWGVKLELPAHVRRMVQMVRESSETGYRPNSGDFMREFEGFRRPPDFDAKAYAQEAFGITTAETDGWTSLPEITARSRTPAI